MRYTYEEKPELGIILCASEDGEVSAIPKDSANSDYQRYLRWLENPDAEEVGTL